MNFKSVIFVFLFFVCSCKKNNTSHNVKLIGHAICGLGNANQIYPNNSKSALNFALSINEISGIEIDLQVTKDLDFVCFHDEFLENSTTGNGVIYNYNLNELIKIEYLGFINQNIMPLSEIKKNDLSDKILIIDITFDSKVIKEYNELYKEKLEKVLSSINCKELFITHENRYFLKKLNVKNAKKFVHVVNFNSGKKWIKSGSFDGIIFRNDLLNINEINEFKKLNLETIIFESRSSSKIKLAISKKPDFLLVDDIIKNIEYVE